MLQMNPMTIKRYLAKGTLDGFKTPGGHYRIFEDSVLKMMGERAEPDMTSTPGY
jgi:predicted site-specific integrase-resolvase